MPNLKVKPDGSHGRVTHVTPAVRAALASLLVAGLSDVVRVPL